MIDGRDSNTLVAKNTNNVWVYGGVGGGGSDLGPDKLYTFPLGRRLGRLGSALFGGKRLSRHDPSLNSG